MRRAAGPAAAQFLDAPASGQQVLPMRLLLGEIPGRLQVGYTLGQLEIPAQGKTN
jgi:hypothetical protein